MKPRYLLFIVVVCLVTLGLFSFPALKGNASGPFKLVVGGKSAPIVSALGKGWFREEGLEIELVEIADFMKYPAVLVSGEIHLFDGYLTAGFWNMVDGGADFRIVSGGSLAVAESAGEPARNIRGYIIRKDLVDNGTIKSIQDLKGRKVADFAPVAKGGTSPFPAAHKIFGTLYGEINWVHLPKDIDIMNALEQKLVDAGRLRAPWYHYAIKKGIGVELFKETDFMPKMQVTTIVTTEKFLKSNSEVMVKFLKAYVKGLSYCEEVQKGKNVEEFKEFIKKYTDVPPNIAVDLIQARKWTDEIAVDDLIYTQKHFVSVGTQKKFIPLEKVVDLTYLKKAKT
ncbi:MAG: ABC transporter substrate-binding protein, partial [Thermodesulfobacteriota bacterium]